MVAAPIGARLEAAEVKSRLQALVGTWYDTDLKRARRSAYTVTLNEAGDGFDVCTYRASGKIIQSANLVRVDDSFCLTWGRRGGAHVFIAVEVNDSSIIWVRGTIEFRWTREEKGFWGKEFNAYWMQEEEVMQYSYEDDCRRGRGRRQLVSAQSRDRSRSRGRAVSEERPARAARTAFEERRPIRVARLKTDSWVNTLAVSLLLKARQSIEEELKGSSGRSSLSSNKEGVFHADIEPLHFNKEPLHFYEALMETPRPAADPFYESLMETPRPKKGKDTTSQQAQKRLRSTCESSPAGQATRVSSSGKKPLVASKLKTSLTPRNALDVGGSDSYEECTDYEEYTEDEYSEDEYSENENSENSSAKEDVALPARNRKGKGWEWPMTNPEKKKAAQKHTENLMTFNPQELFDEISKLEENLRGKKMSVKELEACAKKTHALQTMLEQHESVGKHKRRISCSF